MANAAVPRVRPGGLVITLGVALAVAAAVAQQAKPEAPMRIEKVTDGLYLVEAPSTAARRMAAGAGTATTACCTRPATSPSG